MAKSFDDFMNQHLDSEADAASHAAQLPGRAPALPYLPSLASVMAASSAVHPDDGAVPEFKKIRLNGSLQDHVAGLQEAMVSQQRQFMEWQRQQQMLQQQQLQAFACMMQAVMPKQPGGGGGVPQSMHAAAQDTAANAAAKEPAIPKEVADELSKLKVKHERNIRSLLKAEQMTKTAESTFATMRDDHTCTRYPPGTKAILVSRVEAEMDETWQKAKDDDFTISFNITKGTTRRRAIELIAFHAVKWRKDIELDFFQDVESNRVAMAKKDHFNSKCSDILKRFADEELKTSLELQEPARQLPPQDTLDAHVEELHRGAVEKVAKERADTLAAKEKEEEIARKKDEAVIEANPASLIRTLIDKFVTKEVAKTAAGFMDSETEDTKDDTTLEKECEKLAELLQKSGLSPGGVQGQLINTKTGNMKTGNDKTPMMNHTPAPWRTAKKWNTARMEQPAQAKARPKAKGAGKGKGKGTNNGKNGNKNSDKHGGKTAGHNSKSKGAKGSGKWRASAGGKGKGSGGTHGAN